MTVQGTRFPWTATPVTTSNIQIHGILIVAQLHQSSLGTCPLQVTGFGYGLTGTLSGGAWTGNGAGQHEIILDNETGLISDSGLGSTPVTTRGTLRDTPQTLTVS